MNENKDFALAKQITQLVAEAGGRVYLVGGGVYDASAAVFSAEACSKSPRPVWQGIFC